MPIRVTSLSYQVLHIGKVAATSYVESAYDHNYDAFDMAVVAAFDVEIGKELEGSVGQGSYFLAGFERFDGPVFSTDYDIESYEELEGGVASGYYSLEVWEQKEGSRTHAYTISAFVEYEDFREGYYALNAFEPNTAYVNSKYGLDVYLINQGYVNGLYDIEVYTDLLAQAISSYDLLTYQQADAPIVDGTFDLDAWEAREAAVGAHWALLTFLQSTGYADSENIIEAFEQAQAKLGFHYDLNALLALQQGFDGAYDVSVYTLAQLGFIGEYALDIYEAFSGFADATHLLNAFEARDQKSVHSYGIDIYLASTGAVDGTYLLEALQAATGKVVGTYLLDATEELFTWVINQETGAPSRYENYNFNAYAQIGESYLAASADGIYLLDGDDDNGANIDAIATVGRTDFDAPEMKRVTAAYLGLNSSGQAHLTLRTDQGQTSGPYKLRQSPEASTTERAKFKRGIKSRYWEFDIQNVDGGDLQIKSAEFETAVIRNRRLKK